MGLLNDICRDENIKLLEYTEELGETLTGQERILSAGGKKYIIFDASASKWEKRFTIAHEIAHHLLGHLNPNATISRQDSENEANIFASILTAFLLFKEYEEAI